ncbi:MAG: hypothetical protein NVV74_01795 [Magnetospirillum sp.]|nr:hypothetical protein [Magnetospirillum sp.]
MPLLGGVFGIVFLTLEGVTGTANMMVWPQVSERVRPPDPGGRQSAARRAGASIRWPSG